MSRASQFPTAANADIALLLEGTFPYVSGGVSSWVNQILQAYPEHRFAIVFLGSRREDYGDFRYALPPNVVHFEQHYLFDALHSNIQPAPSRGHPEALAKAREFLGALEAHDGSAESRAKVLAAMRSIALELQPGGSPAAACRWRISCTANSPGT